MTRIPSLGRRGEGWVGGQFVLLAVIGLAALAGPAWDAAARTVGLVIGAGLVVVGGALAVRGSVDLRAALTPFPAPRTGSALVEAGVYGRIRHPIYAGLLLGAFGWSLAWATLPGVGLAVVLFAWLDLKSRREEAWLMARYPTYLDYRSRTRRFVPGLY
jgi:protein-S-isoprenylcysteine O-methyltransferase Ste14